MDLPGYYYDAERQRYFKVEKNQTAPADAAWSSSNVKRRRLNEEEAAAALQHQDRIKSRIKRASVLREPLTGGFFAREHGAVADDMEAACFVAGLRNKGRISLVAPRIGTARGSLVRHFYVGGQDNETGLCTVFGLSDACTLLSTYLARDKNKRLNQNLLANYRLHDGSPQPYIEKHMFVVTDIQHHAPSNTIFVARAVHVPSSQGECSYLFRIQPTSISVDDDALTPRWKLPVESVTPLESRGEDQGTIDCMAQCIAPAPGSSRPSCVVGAEQGIVLWDADTEKKLHHCLAPATSPRDLVRDVWAVDFGPNQTNVFQFGGRPGFLFTADARLPYQAWQHVQLPAAITKLKCLGDGKQVLVAGLRNQLGVYDLRFTPSHRGVGRRIDSSVDIPIVEEADPSDTYHSLFRNSRQLDKTNCRCTRTRNQRSWKQEWNKMGKKFVADPVIEFEQYRNAAHTKIGFAYDADTGVVAAAHDAPGIVALYSVRTGAQLRIIDFATESQENAGPRSHSNRNNSNSPSTFPADHPGFPVIEGIQFQTLPGDATPTLFIGGDLYGGLTAFSFGVDDSDDEA
ncbi:hypothetical protein F4777DRAFT_441258 [Nemania sp. FL0916]|nr:hypothetical protein F4777DRAFT_441258 [Nemania sp. FL0916]